MTEEELEFNQMLDKLGPRFVDWWGTCILLVDADLLPQKILSYKTPYKVLPTGMSSNLTNAELTNLQKLVRNFPCHFALGIAFDNAHITFDYNSFYQLAAHAFL
jgi:hypothetical protein